MKSTRRGSSFINSSNNDDNDNHSNSIHKDNVNANINIIIHIIISKIIAIIIMIMVISKENDVLIKEPGSAKLRTRGLQISAPPNRGCRAPLVQLCACNFFTKTL